MYAGQLTDTLIKAILIDTPIYFAKNYLINLLWLIPFVFIFIKIKQWIKGRTEAYLPQDVEVEKVTKPHYPSHFTFNSDKTKFYVTPERQEHLPFRDGNTRNIFEKLHIGKGEWVFVSILSEELDIPPQTVRSTLNNFKR